MEIGYVKRKGTCAKCKKKKNAAPGEELIAQGELYWTKEG